MSDLLLGVGLGLVKVGLRVRFRVSDRARSRDRAKFRVRLTTHSPRSLASTSRTQIGLQARVMSDNAYKPKHACTYVIMQR